MKTGLAFEKMVINVARNLWPSAEYSGGEIHAGRERDGVFITEDVIHLLECTELRTRDKAEGDGRKLAELATQFKRSHPESPIKCWLVTKDEPTPDQRVVVKTLGIPIAILSFQQFQARLVKASEYLELRNASRFGSISDPKTGGTGDKLPYVEIDLIEPEGSQLFTVAEIANKAGLGERFCLFGDFGVGKSMTLRELYRKLAAKYHKGETTQFPVYINLREHHGQTQPVEIIERHARLIGFSMPSQIVRAWKSGYCILLLDGFDEISSLGLQGGWRRLKEVRAASMHGLRGLIADSPPSTGIVVAGRNSFFDSDTERRKSTGTGDFTEINLSEFTELQIERFLQLYGYKGRVPSWMPSRPLLLGALFAKGVKALTGDEASQKQFDTDDAADGWNMLVQEICEREAKIESGLSGDSIRAILENLATRARATATGLGPLSPSEMSEAFQECCGYSPADQALTVLQRLSGLGTDPAKDDDSRNFIDVDFADACRAGMVVKFLGDPYATNWPVDHGLIKHVLGDVGLGVVARNFKITSSREGQLKAAFSAIDKGRVGDVVKFDLVQLALLSKQELTSQIFIDGIDIPNFSIRVDQNWLGKVTFSNSSIQRLQIDPSVSSGNCPNFIECIVDEMDGRVSAKDLPEGRFTGCVFESFSDDVKTNSAVFKTEAPVAVKVLLSALKRLFVQSLSGREEGAFSRGMDASSVGVVPEVLAILRRFNFAIRSDRSTDKVWLPVRRRKGDVLEILSAPMTSQHPLVVACRKLNS